MSSDRLLKLQQLSDEELFEIDCHLAVEYQARIIELLEKHDVTQFIFDRKIEDLPYSIVFDYNNGSKNIQVVSVGYTTDMFGTKRFPGKCLYLVDTNNVVYCGEDCVLDNTLWDIYREMKEYLK